MRSGFREEAGITLRVMGPPAKDFELHLQAIGDIEGSDRIKCASLKSHFSSSVEGLESGQRNKLGGCCNKLLTR